MLRGDRSGWVYCTIIVTSFQVMLLAELKKRGLSIFGYVEGYRNLENIRERSWKSQGILKLGMGGDPD